MIRTITLDRAGDVFAIVDADDYAWLSAWTWHLYDYRGVRYAKRTAMVRGRRTTIYMHREIAKRHIAGRTKSRKLVDHRDSNGLNNRRENLRWATPQMNRHNQNGCRWRHMTDLLDDHPHARTREAKNARPVDRRPRQSHSNAADTDRTAGPAG